MSPPEHEPCESAALASERRAVLAALRNINTSLPWGRRILLGPDIAERLATEDIPEDEIHVHFTDGKALWPTDEEGEAYGPNVLGLGGSNVYRDRSRILGGYALFDREAIGRGNARMEFVVTHEILHAWGMGAHVDPYAYPNAVLAPFVPRNLKGIIYVITHGPLRNPRPNRATRTSQAAMFSCHSLSSQYENSTSRLS